MSTTSTLTTLVAHDHTLDNDSELLNCMCVLPITRGDGILFDATSIQEEGIVELCVKVGQVHPKGMLQLLVTELIILFCSSEEMLATAHMVTKAMAWCEEPIKLCTSLPSTAHLRVYIAGRNPPHQALKSLTPEGEEVPWLPPSNPHPNGRAPCQFHMDLRDLGDAQLWQLMEDIWQEVAQSSVHSQGAFPWANRRLWQEVGTPTWKMRRLPSQEGGDADPADSHCGPLAPSNRGGCWVSYQYPSHQVVTGYSKNKYFQW